MTKAAAALALAFVATSAAASADAGPRRGIREVRAMLPAVMQAWLAPNGLSGPVRTDDVEVGGDAATARWTAGDAAIVTRLVYREARWWVTSIRRASDPDRTLLPPLGNGSTLVRDEDGYVATVGPAGAPYASAAWFDRAPTDAEMVGGGADGIYYLSLQLAAGRTAAFPAHATLDVWCPFFLDPELRYSLTIADVEPPVGPLDGTLRDNVLHFDLPAFTAPAGAEIQAEIDWLYRR